MRAVSAVQAAPAPSDRCPGALRLHEAADGLLARLRLPGGIADARVLRGLAALSEDIGDGRVELTSRGNLQLRGIAPADTERLADVVADLGLLPSSTHERVRNIVASPAGGLAGGGPDLTAAVRALDAGLCARPGLAALSGRFLFGLDDGTGDIRALRPDILATAGTDGRWHLEPGEIAVLPADLISCVLAAAECFLAERAAQGSSAWRVADLPDGRRAVGARTRARLDRDGIAAAAMEQAGSHAVSRPDPPGYVEVIAPLGRLSAGELRLLAAHAGPLGVRVTPWRTVVMPAPLDPDALRRSASERGLTDGRWRAVSACTGRPGCAHALADVQADARVAVLGGSSPAGRRVHWSGCERRCGHPSGGYLDVLATTTGYAETDIAPGAAS